jgi:hypothetical protein
MERMPPTPPGVVRQRLITAAAGLGVAALAGLAFVLSYDDLRVLALTGGAAKRYAPYYPVMIDILVGVTILALVVARRTRWWVRGVRWLLLLVLLAGAAAASAQRAVKGYDPIPDKWLSAGVAVAPWVLLLIAVWLWLSMFRQVRALLQSRPDGPAPSSAEVRPTGTVRVMPTTAGVIERAEPVPDSIVPGLGPARATPPLASPEPPVAEPEPPIQAEPAPAPAEPRPANNTPVEQPDAGSAPEPAPAAAPSARPTLPTDVKLVARPTETTQPDLVMPQPASDTSTEDVGASRAEGTAAPPEQAAGSADPVGTEEDDDVERWSELAAEDAERWAEEAADSFGDADSQPAPTPPVEWIPPSSRFRSSPTPPRD